jgi:hypothetical protein
MTRVEQYRTMLKKTETILKRKPTTASELAKQLRTSRQTAYSRIDALKEFCTVEETFSRVGSRGPATTLFFISAGGVPDA